ncbi:hypothetical protein HYALB_00004325 [Hymenoscyphus albidus]|uniref:Uncharacterized protein n=1 Tax=Hymenoscyphus albidus TaxID=595503 RepID=A0A9N9LYQ0_9HELO|nr:hypothetical protein HYALB_00004325 [Hymenoscyphus albidus]
MSSQRLEELLANDKIGNSDWRFNDRLYALAVAYMVGHSNAAEVKILLDSLYEDQDKKCLYGEHDVRSTKYELRPKGQRDGRLMTAEDLRAGICKKNITWNKQQDSFWLFGIFRDFLEDPEGEMMKVGGLPPVDPSTRKPVEPPWGLTFPGTTGFSEAREPTSEDRPSEQETSQTDGYDSADDSGTGAQALTLSQIKEKYPGGPRKELVAAHKGSRRS